jgi:hypothetical protein
METRKRNDGDAAVFMDLMFLCRFLLFGMSEARELPSNGGLVEFSLWN